MTSRYGAGLAVATGERASAVARTALHALGRLRGAGWALADQCVVSAVNFLTVYLFARYLETSTFGTYILAYTGLLLMTNLQNALVIQPHNVLAAGLGQKAFATFTGALALLQAAYCLAIGVTLGALGWLIAHVHSPAAGHTVIALAFAAVPWLGQEFVRRVLYTRGQVRAAAANDAITYGLQLFGVLVLVQAAAPWATPASALSVLGLSSAVGMGVGIWQLRHHVRFDREVVLERARTWSETWKFGRWLTAQNVLAWFGAQGHSWVVGLLLGVEQVGIYRAATHLINVMNPVMQASFSYLPSRGSLARQNGGAEGLARWVNRLRRVLLLALAPFVVVLAGFPGRMLEFAYGEKYSGTNLALILSLAAIAQCIGFSKYPFDLGLLAMRSTRSIFFVYLIPVVLLLTVGTALIHFLGILGVPLSAITINSALLIATWLAYRRCLERERSGATGGISA